MLLAILGYDLDEKVISSSNLEDVNYPLVYFKTDSKELQEQLVKTCSSLEQDFLEDMLSFQEDIIEISKQIGDSEVIIESPYLSVDNMCILFEKVISNMKKANDKNSQT